MSRGARLRSPAYSARGVRAVKAFVFAASLGPAVSLAWAAWTHQLNVNPFNAIVRNTGLWSLRFLCLTIAITPLRWLTGWNDIVKGRRMLGLFAFFYGTLHVLAYVLFDRVAGLEAPDPARPLAMVTSLFQSIGADLWRPFFAIGWVAFALMVPLAATSTVGMIRRLGGRRWRTVHRLVYIVVIMTVVHTYWPLTARAYRYEVIAAVVFALRLGRAYALRQPARMT